MALPNPERGLIIHYSYVFHARTRNIGDAGKNRPCLIVAVFPDPDDKLKTGVLYLPISHSPLGADDAGIELTADAKYAAGLDGARQWVLVSQGNQDTWPEDIANLPGRPGEFVYGFMPPATFRAIQLAFAGLYAQRKFGIVPRNAPPAG
jgi:hypothetical protein